VVPCDLLRPNPLGIAAIYDLVTSFFCAECVTQDRTEWEQVVSRLAGLVAPGGTLFLAAMRATHAYAVCGQWLPVIPVTEEDFPPILVREGFETTSIVAEAVAVPDWADEGFEAIVVIRASKR
jgi:hypothetical protein